MPVYGPQDVKESTLLAGAAIVRNRFVKRGADADHCIQATANSVNLGVARDPQDVVEGVVPIAHTPGDLVQVEAGGAFALDALLTSDANGAAVTAASTNIVSAVARQAATGAGDLVLVELVGPRVVAP